MSTPRASSDLSERRPLLHRNPNRRSSRPSFSPASPTTPSVTTLLGSRGGSTCRTRAAGVFILLSLAFERIAFYGLAANLVLFLNKDPFTWDYYFTVGASLYFFGVSFVTSLIGGWLADSILGRFKGIVTAFAIYIAGYAVMPFLALRSGTVKSQNLQHNATKLPNICNWAGGLDSSKDDDDDPFDEPCAWLVYIVLTIIAVGTGFVKASIAPFGSDQVAREGQQVTLRFFNWFYWAVNFGALIGLTAVTYLQQQVGFYYGYLMAIICLSVAMFLFLIGRFFYTVRPADGSVLANIFRIIREAWRRKRQQKRTRTLSGRSYDGQKVDEAEPSETRLSFLDYAKHRHGGCFHDALVDDVKELKKIICVFAAFIPYWIVYFQVVAAWFSIFDVIVLILLLPIFDQFIYPRLERRGWPLTLSRRILVGMVFAIMAMIAAGVVEHFRLEAFWPNDTAVCQPHFFNQTIGDSVYFAADMSVLWQIPQYVLIGVSEVFTSVAGLQFAVSMAPNSMKGIIMGLFYMFSGIGSFIGTGIITTLSVSKVWLFNDKHDLGINCRGCKDPSDTHYTYACHLDYYFYLLAGIELFGMFMFILINRAYKLDQARGEGAPGRPLRDASGDFADPACVQPRRSLPHTIQRSMSGDLSS